MFIFFEVTTQGAALLHSVKKDLVFMFMFIYKWEPLGYNNLAGAVHPEIMAWNPAQCALIKCYYLKGRSGENNNLVFSSNF